MFEVLFRITLERLGIGNMERLLHIGCIFLIPLKMRKQGKKHSTLTVLPNGMRRDTKWELPVRAALLALDTGNLTEQQCIDLFVLAEMSQRTGAKGHYLEHAKTLHRLICDIGDRVGHPVDRYEALAISASVPVLLEYMQKVKNLDIAKAALREVKK